MIESMTQDGVDAVLRAKRGEMTIWEVAVAANLDYRTAAKNLQDLGKWRAVTVRTERGVKMFKVKD